MEFIKFILDEILDQRRDNIGSLVWYEAVKRSVQYKWDLDPGMAFEQGDVPHCKFGNRFMGYHSRWRSGFIFWTIDNASIVDRMDGKSWESHPSHEKGDLVI
jgi:hypothetical protein